MTEKISFFLPDNWNKDCDSNSAHCTAGVFFCDISNMTQSWAILQYVRYIADKILLDTSDHLIDTENNNQHGIQTENFVIWNVFNIC